MALMRKIVKNPASHPWVGHIDAQHTDKFMVGNLNLRSSLSLMGKSKSISFSCVYAGSTGNR